MKKEKIYVARFGNGDYDYFTINENDLNEYEKKEGYLSEGTLFEKAFTNMILSNNILKILNYDEIEEIISAYDEENDSYMDEYQFFIVDSQYNEEDIKNMMKLSENTLYYSNELDNYIIGITDLGTERHYVLTDIKLEEV